MVPSSVSEHIPLLRGNPEAQALLEHRNGYVDSEFLGIEGSVDTALVADAFRRRGFETVWISPSIVYALGDGIILPFSATRTLFLPLITSMAASNKFLSKAFLKAQSVPVPDGAYFKSAELERGLAYAQPFLPDVVVKPVDGGNGVGVTVGVRDAAEFRAAWAYACSYSGAGVVIESKFEGTLEARFLVVDGVCLSITGRLPPFVIGNGVDSLAELVAQKNAERRTNPSLADKLIKLEADRTERLRAAGLGPDDVVERGRFVMIDAKAGLSTGAESMQLLGCVHASYLALAEVAAGSIPGMQACGVDIMARDFTQPATPENCVVIELNDGPGIGGHHFPVYGAPKDVAASIVDQAIRRYREGAPEALATAARDVLAATADEIAAAPESLHRFTWMRKWPSAPAVDYDRVKRVRVMVVGDVGSRKLRRFVRDACVQHGIDGWVRYRSDGWLQCLMTGPAHAVDEVVSAIREGPFAERVRSVTVQRSKAAVSPGFVIRRTYRAAVLVNPTSGEVRRSVVEQRWPLRVAFRFLRRVRRRVRRLVGV